MFLQLVAGVLATPVSMEFDDLRVAMVGYPGLIRKVLPIASLLCASNATFNSVE